MTGYFFVIGGQRCGTSLLRQVLDDHLAVEMARPFHPEPKWYLRADRPSGVEEFARSLFSSRPGIRWRGEKATSYIEYPSAARSIAAEIPEARVVAVVREPIARAISNYAYSRRNGVEERAVEAALAPGAPGPEWDHDRFSVSPYAYLERGQYVAMLEPWRELFGARLKVLLFDDLVSGRAVEGLFDFLDLPPPGPAAPLPRVNASDSAGVPISTTLRARLREYYAPWNAALSSVYGLDLAGWHPAE